MPRKLTGRVEPRPKSHPTRWIVRLGDYSESFDDPAVAAMALEEALDLKRKGASKRSFAVQFIEYMDKEEILQRERRGNARQFNVCERSLARHIEASKFWLKLTRKVTREDIRELLDTVVGSPATRWNRHTAARVPTGKLIGRRTGEAIRARLSHFFDHVAGGPEINPAVRAPIKNIDKMKRRDAGDDLMPHLHLDEIARLYALPLDKFSLRERAVYALGIYAGLRTGELVGLQWQDIVRLYDERPELHVRNSYDSLTKTLSSQREVPMLPELVGHLRAYVASLPARPVAGLVFPNREGRMMAHGWPARWYDHTTGRWDKLSHRPGLRTLAGIRPTIMFRHLRHTCGTHLCNGGYGRAWDVERVAQLLGHSSSAITRRHYISRHVSVLHAELAKSAT